MHSEQSNTLKVQISLSFCVMLQARIDLLSPVIISTRMSVALQNFPLQGSKVLVQLTRNDLNGNSVTVEEM